jgi:hypothetical protein
VNDPEAARLQSEKLTRGYAGTDQCPIPGIPNSTTTTAAAKAADTATAATSTATSDDDEPAEPTVESVAVEKSFEDSSAHVATDQ